MKRTLFALLCLVALIVPFAAAMSTQSAAAAVDVFGACNSADGGFAGNTDVCKDKGSEGSTNPVIKTLKIAITIMAFAVGVAAVIMIIISGINMITSGGDPQKVASARNTLLYAVIGVVIAVFAESIVAFVLNKL